MFLLSKKTATFFIIFLFIYSVIGTFTANAGFFDDLSSTQSNLSASISSSVENFINTLDSFLKNPFGWGNNPVGNEMVNFGVDNTQTSTTTVVSNVYPTEIKRETIVTQEILSKARILEALKELGFYNRDEVNNIISSLQASTDSNIAKERETTNFQTTALTDNLALSGDISQMRGVTFIEPTVEGGISGLTDSDIPDDITASNYMPLLGGSITGVISIAGDTTIGTSIADGRLTVMGVSTTTGNAFTVTDSATTSLFTILNTGNIGIGTSSPYAKLSVAGQIVADYFTSTSTTGTSTLPDISSTNISATNIYGFTLLGNIIGNLKDILGLSNLSVYQASTSRMSSTDRIYIGSTSTTTIVGDGGTSTIAGTLSVGTTTMTNLIVTNTGTSTIAGTLDINGTTGTSSITSNLLIGSNLRINDSLYSAGTLVFDSLRNLSNINNASTSALTVSGNSYLGTTTITYLTVGNTGTSTMTSLEVLTLGVTNNSYLGTISSGTWNASVIGDAYLTKTGDWIGIFDGLQGADYLANSFSSTSASHWYSSADRFSTSTTDYWLSQNRGNAFSTTSATYFANASGTIPKTYTDNTFTNNNTFSASTTFQAQSNIEQSSTTKGTITTFWSTLANIVTGLFTNTIVTSTSTTGSIELSTANSGIKFQDGTYQYTNPNSFIHASGTIPKMYSDNIFTSHNIFSSLFATSASSTNATTTNLTVSNNTYLPSGIWNSSGNVGIGTTTPEARLTIQGTTATDLPTYGDEVLSADGWISTDWTGSWASGWTHTPGNYSVLSQSTPAVVGTKYQVAYTITGRTAGHVDISFGGVSATSLSSTGSRGVVAISTANLTITPSLSNTFNGTIIISIKPITASSSPLIAFASSDGVTRIEIRAGTGSSNTFVGVNSGENNNIFAYDNSALGYNAFAANIGGYSDSAFGTNALAANNSGYSNSAFGTNALAANNSGYSNSAFGTNALLANTEGYSNSAFGANTLSANTTGVLNSAFGQKALYFNTTGIGNSAFGNNVLYSNKTSYYNSAIGESTLYSNTTGSNNSAVGWMALRSNTTGASNSAIGDSALYYNTTGSHNSAIGSQSLYNAKPTSKAITGFSDYSATVEGTVKATSSAHTLSAGTTAGIAITGTTNYDGTYAVTYIDANSFYFTKAWVADDATGWWGKETEGRYNTAVGAFSGNTLTIGDSNTFLGYYAGYNGSQLNSATNSMALGNGAYTTASNQVVIGNTNITETLLRGNVGIGTTSPYTELAVAGTVVADNYIATSTIFASSFPYASSTALTVSGNTYFANDSIWTSSGFVGIGTTSPWAKLSINNYSAGVSTAPLFVVSSSTGSLATSTAFFINSFGNVGIGTSNPISKLEVVGDIVSKGTYWASSTSATNNNWKSVVYGNGLFVAVAGSPPHL